MCFVKKGIVMADPNEAARLRVLECVKSEIVIDVDGFYRFWPVALGCHCSHELRWIADELDRLNKPWEELIEREIGKAGE